MQYAGLEHEEVAMASWWKRGAAALVAGLGLVAIGSAPAHAAGEIDTYTAEAVIRADGSVDVKATITFPAGATPPTSVTQRFATTVETTGERDYHYALTDVTAGGAPAQVATDADSVAVTIPVSGQTATLAYTVTGASVRADETHTAVAWGYLQGLGLSVGTFDLSVGVDALTQFSSVDCKTGAAAAPAQACTHWGGGTHDLPSPVFHQDGVAAGEVVRATVLFEGDAIAVNEDVRDRWTLGRAFTPGPAQVVIALAIAVLAVLGLWLAHRRFGRDATASEPIRVAEFHPIGEGRSEFRVLDGVRPGQVGTVLDEHVDPVDVTATLLDLAVRGHLRIRELPRAAAYANAEWTFERLGQPDDGIAAYERTLLDAVAPDGGEPATVSALGERVAPVVGEVRSQLYDDVVSRGWFVRRPDAARGLWDRVGWVALGVAVVATIVLAALTTYGLIGLALIVAALAMLVVAQEMPARTAAGVGMLSGLSALGAILATQPTEQVGGIGQLSRVVPYAVVLGGTGRWLAALDAVCQEDVPDAEELYWYHGPEGWQVSDLPASLDNFVTTVQGKLFSR